jgi:hypothetical protein
LRVLGPTVRWPLTGGPLSPRRCMSPLGGHEDAQFYVSSHDRAMSALGH